MFDALDFQTPDWKDSGWRRVDAIYLTARGQRATHLSFPRNLYGWDCECVFILNPKCVTPVHKKARAVKPGRR